jgi:adenylate cyclase
MSISHDTENLAIVFADICGSTAMYDNLGDAMARRMIASCIACMNAVVEAHRGVVVKTIGDEIMCTFATAEIGLLAAFAMQTSVKNAHFEGNHRMTIRVGCHCGNVIREVSDIYGDTVNIAARVASMARANQIMSSQAIVDSIPEKLRNRAHRIMAAEFKGKQIETNIFLVAWDAQESDHTLVQLKPNSSTLNAATELTLYYAGKFTMLNKNHKQLFFGRGETCDIVIPSSLVSRQHAGVEMRFGKCFIVDQSANGTYVRSDEGEITHITRQEMVLQGSGHISLGQPFEENPVEVIQFSIGLMAA